MVNNTSVASNTTALIGLFALGAGIAAQLVFPIQQPVSAALFLVFCYLIPVAIFEIVALKVHKRPSTDLYWGKPSKYAPDRVVTKLIGLFGVVLLIAIIHLLIPIYPLRHLIFPLIGTIFISPILIPIIVLYFLEIDRRMIKPKDGYFEFGSWILRRNADPDWNLLRNFCLGWTIKGIFLPIMFTYLSAGITNLNFQFEILRSDPVEVVLFISKIIVIMELSIVVVGYTMTVRLFDAHIRSPNNLLFGWVVTIICYEPLNQVVFSKVLDFRNDQNWTDVINGYPVLMWPWLALIVLSYVIWLWATAIFGLRWSNLTNRGIITNGPYKFTKHPDYVAKSAFFWLTAAPFLTALTTWEAILASVALIVVNLIYYGRARTEEIHLSEEPDYVAYAMAMNQRSIFKSVARIFPFLLYKPSLSASDS